MAETISINGTAHPIPDDPRITLLDFLRHDLRLVLIWWRAGLLQAGEAIPP